jgi:hypothetical protein
LTAYAAQLKRLKLRKNNWDGETYEFDEVLTEFASQKRVYEVVARPVVEVCIHSYLSPGGFAIFVVHLCFHERSDVD